MNIDEQINALYGDLTSEISQDDEIEDQARALAAKILVSRRTQSQLLGRSYTVSFMQKRVGDQLINELVAIDHVRLSLAGLNRYNPLTFNAVANTNLTEFENIYALTETFVRYKYGGFKIEDLEGDEA